jgi:hypothetical protein
MSNTNEKILPRQATEQETEQTSRHYGKVPQNNANNRMDNPMKPMTPNEDVTRGNGILIKLICPVSLFLFYASDFGFWVSEPHLAIMTLTNSS